MQHGGGDPRALQAAGQFVSEHHIGQLGLAVGALPRVIPLGLQIAEVNAAPGLGAGGDGDDPGGYVLATWAARRRTCAWADMSAAKTSTAALPVAARMPAAAASVRA